MITSIDYETYYHKKLCSVAVEGVYKYLRHPEFDAYLVSVVTDEGDEFCGHPTDFDWSCIEDDIWLSHNKGFDHGVHKYLIETGVIKSKMPDKWYCTADLAAYCALPRALSKVLKYLFGHEMDKGIRDAMSGKRWEDLMPDEKEELIEYALDDSRWLHPLWEKLSPNWPESERIISNLTIDMKDLGLPVDAEKIDGSVRMLKTTMFNAEEAMPWWGSKGYKNKTPLSPVAMANECTRLGIPAPTSRAKESEEATKWIKKYGKKHKFVQAMQDWNSCNTLLKRMEKMQSRVDVHKDGSTWMPYGLKYCGTHTGRDAGTDKFNVLNMNKYEVFGVDIRSHIVAPKGYKFLSADYSQIEPRILAWIVGDWDFIDAVADGEDPYVTFGLKTIKHKGEWDADDRALWKVMVLQLGYQSGGEKFQGKANQMGVEMTLKEAKNHVKVYRQKNTKVVKYWKRLQREMIAASPGKKGDGWLAYVLPSGRKQVYREISRLHGLTGVIAGEYGWTKKHLYGGLLCENMIQAIARDVFMCGTLKIHEAGMKNVLRVYDEFLILVREEEAEDRRLELLDIMSTTPEWAPGLPIAAECDIIDYYRK